MPPLGFEGLEAVREHGRAQDHAVLKLLVGDAAIIRVTLLSEPVEGSAHVQFLPRLHIEQSQVDSISAGVPALFHDILLLEEHALVEIGIEAVFHRRSRPSEPRQPV